MNRKVVVASAFIQMHARTVCKRLNCCFLSNETEKDSLQYLKKKQTAMDPDPHPGTPSTEGAVSVADFESAVDEENDDERFDAPACHRNGDNFDLHVHGQHIFTARLQPEDTPDMVATQSSETVTLQKNLFAVCAWRLPLLKSCGDHKQNIQALADMRAHVPQLVLRIVEYTPGPDESIRNYVEIQCSVTDTKFSGWPDTIAWCDRHLFCAATVDADTTAHQEGNGVPVYRTVLRLPLIAPLYLHGVNSDSVAASSRWTVGDNSDMRLRVFSLDTSGDSSTDADSDNSPQLSWSEPNMPSQIFNMAFVGAVGDDAVVSVCDIATMTVNVFTLTELEKHTAAPGAAWRPDLRNVSDLCPIPGGAISSTNEGISIFHKSSRRWDLLYRCTAGALAFAQWDGDRPWSVVVRLWEETNMVLVLDVHGAAEADPECISEFSLPTTWNIADWAVAADSQGELRCVFVRLNAVVVVCDVFGRRCVRLDMFSTIVGAGCPAPNLPAVEDAAEGGAVEENEEEHREGSDVPGGSQPRRVLQSWEFGLPVEDPETEAQNAEDEDEVSVFEDFDSISNTNITGAAAIGDECVAVGMDDGVVQIHNLRNGNLMTHVNLNGQPFGTGTDTLRTGNVVVLASTQTLHLFSCEGYLADATDVESTVSKSDPDAHSDTPVADPLVTEDMRMRFLLTPRGIFNMHCNSVDITECEQFIACTEENTFRQHLLHVSGNVIERVWSSSDDVSYTMFVGHNYFLSVADNEWGEVETFSVRQFSRGWDNESRRQTVSVHSALSTSPFPLEDTIREACNIPETIEVAGSSRDTIAMYRQSSNDFVVVWIDPATGLRRGTSAGGSAGVNAHARNASIFRRRAQCAILSMSLSKDGSLLCICGKDNSFSLWDLHARTCLADLPPARDFARRPCAFSGNNHYLLTFRCQHDHVRAVHIPVIAGGRFAHTFELSVIRTLSGTRVVEDTELEAGLDTESSEVADDAESSDTDAEGSEELGTGSDGAE